MAIVSQLSALMMAWSFRGQTVIIQGHEASRTSSTQLLGASTASTASWTLKSRTTTAVWVS